MKKSEKRRGDEDGGYINEIEEPKYVVQSKDEKWWLNGCDGDPGRTVMLEYAQMYTKEEAENAKKKAVCENGWFRAMDLEIVEVKK